MSDQVPGLGQLSDIPKPAPNPNFDGLQLAQEDWFVLSRVDGSTAIKDIFALSPKGKDETVAILRRLADNGLIELPSGGAAPAKAPAPAAPSKAAPAVKRITLPAPPATWPEPLATFKPDPELMAVESPLDDDYKKYLLYFHDNLRRVTYYDLFGVSEDAKSGAIKKAYFKLSKVFHPDRFFRVDLGPLSAIQNEVFRWLNEAQKTLGNKRRREEYDEYIEDGTVGPWVDEDDEEDGVGTVRPRRPLQDILAEAKAAERNQDYPAAATLFDEALKQRPDNAEIMVRVAECLIRAKANLTIAEERARKAIELAPEGARYHVALAYIHELTGRNDDAIAGYKHALTLDPTHQGAKARLARMGQ